MQKKKGSGKHISGIKYKHISGIKKNVKFFTIQEGVRT